MANSTRLQRKDILIRGLQMLLFGFFINLGLTIIGFLAFVQFFWLLINREKNLFMWQFLKKIIQPISVSIFVLLALIFCQAFLRDYSIAYKVLTGVVLTIFFNFTEKIAGNVSIVFGFSPLVTTFIFLLGLVSLIFIFSKRL